MAHGSTSLLTALTCSGLLLQFHALARIVPTTSVPTFVKPSTSSHAAASHVWRKKGDIRLSDLPHHLQVNFADKFTPHLYELFGTLSAWEQPTENDIGRLWKKIFPHERSLNFGTSEGAIVLKLVSILTTFNDPRCTNMLHRPMINFRNGGRNSASMD